MFDLFLLCILFSSSCCFWFLLLSYFVYFLNFGYLSKTSLKNWQIAKKNKKSKNEKCTKKDILTRAVCTGVLTNSVFFSFCVSLNFAIFAENTINIGRCFQQQKKKKKKHKKKTKNLVLKTGPS